MDINREVMETSLNVCEEVQEKDTKDNPPSTSQENFQIKQEVVIKEEAIDIPENEDYVSECEEEKKRVCPYFVTDGLTFEKELECLLMSSNSNEQGIGYSQLQRKLLETYPKMLKEPHNILRKHKSKGPLSVLTTAISDRRRKRREG
ncbi:hypothetical protein Avbf_06682 [Armadillidium vulgare]|nr:hypothetical protein Avbf_06682 [Armadillidium vulgare]